MLSKGKLSEGQQLVSSNFYMWMSWELFKCSSKPTSTFNIDCFIPGSSCRGVAAFESFSICSHTTLGTYQLQPFWKSHFRRTSSLPVSTPTNTTSKKLWRLTAETGLLITLVRFPWGPVHKTLEVWPHSLLHSWQRVCPSPVKDSPQHTGRQVT